MKKEEEGFEEEGEPKNEEPREGGAPKRGVVAVDGEPKVGGLGPADGEEKEKPGRGALTCPGEGAPRGGKLRIGCAIRRDGESAKGEACDGASANPRRPPPAIFAHADARISESISFSKFLNSSVSMRVR